MYLIHPVSLNAASESGRRLHALREGDAAVPPTEHQGETEHQRLTATQRGCGEKSCKQEKLHKVDREPTDRKRKNREVILRKSRKEKTYSISILLRVYLQKLIQKIERKIEMKDTDKDAREKQTNK